MKLPVYLYGHPVLREISDDITPEYPELKKLVDDMFETMYASEGVGLAAPQIGRNDRIVVIDANPVAENFPECAGWKKALINPEIEVLDGIEHIPLSYLDENFTPHEEEISGYLARIVQHECDHLEGMLYIDHISPIRKQLIRSKLTNILNGRIRCAYHVKYAPRHKK